MSLLDKSLLRRETIAEVARYTLHEFVRQFAAERLDDDPEIRRTTAERHSSYYARLLQQSIDPQTGASPSGSVGQRSFHAQC
jgi:predicted ATPase